MPGFMIGGTLFIRFRDDSALFLRSHDDLVDPLVQFKVPDHVFSRTSRQNRRFVEQIGKIGPGEPARHAGDHLEIDVGGQGLIAGMDLEDRLSALDVGQIDVDLPVKTSGTEQRTVQNIRTVGCRHYNDAFVGLEAVHLHEDLVERLFPFVVTAPKSRPSLTADRVDFVDKDDTGLIAFCHIKQVAHTRGTDTDIHFHEVRAADGEERNARFSGNRLGK